MATQATSWLEQRHRLETLVEPFGAWIEVDSDGAREGRVPYAAVAQVRLDGRCISADALASRARDAGLRADERGIVLRFDAPIEAEEDALLAVLNGLLEADPGAFLRMAERGIDVPLDGWLPASSAWLERFYGGDSVPRDKKPVVVDLRRCRGPYLRSVDIEPLQIVDAASQLASLPAGFRPGPVQAALDDGRFDPHLIAGEAAPAAGDLTEASKFARALLAHAPPSISHVTFANSGSEANEKALHIARVNGPGGRRVVAFEGAFHGRTLLSLFSTWNPAKRARYQLPGFETTFLPFPNADAAASRPAFGIEWTRAWAERCGSRDGLAGDGSDTILAAEVASLARLEAEIEKGDVLACIVEPYQCEGGERGATARFFHGLRALTRAHGVPLIFDEMRAIEAVATALPQRGWREGADVLRIVAESDGGSLIVAEDPDGVVGFAAGGPLELWWAIDGPRGDPRRGAGDTFFCADIAVLPRARGRGIATRLRAAQLRSALAARSIDGQWRYAFVTGRDRVGAADEVGAVNARFGAYDVVTLRGQYGDAESTSRYYRIPLRRHDRRPFAKSGVPASTVALGSGVYAPTGPSHPALIRARALGVFDEPALTKLTVSNFITRPYARHAELMRSMAPRELPHLYFTSSPDEMVDKTIRALEHNRAAGRFPIGVEGGYFGHTTAACRSISDPNGAVVDDGPGRRGFFGWPQVPHPTTELEACVTALDAIVEREGAEAVIGVFIEAVQAHTGHVISERAWSALCAWRDRVGVPLVVSETCTGGFRNGRSMWWSDGVDGRPDVVLWWAGGQIGHVFSRDSVYVAEPLALISTWDGDELSAVRLDRQLYEMRRVPLAPRVTRVDEALATVGMAGRARGLGLYRVLRLSSSEADSLDMHLAAMGLSLERPAGYVAGARDARIISPPVTVATVHLDRLAEALAEWGAESRQ